MRILTLLFLTFFVSASGAMPSSALSAVEFVHHDLSLTLLPAEHRLSVTDVITVPRDQRDIHFILHEGLRPVSPDPRVKIVKLGGREGTAPVEAFTVALPQGVTAFTVRYAGTIHHPIETTGKEQARGFDRTAGVISEDGVYLAGSSFWYPRLETETGLATFTLEVELPAGWDTVSQGSRALHEKTKKAARVRWQSPEPQDDIYVVASRFAEYEKKSGKLEAMVFLRSPDPGLAGKYLDAAIRYITMYDTLIGPYPYDKFALVENFWETGLGMPSFTLLGPTVIRLPFIIASSYPHEILHNWWGNGVYPVYEKGNWSEGLTAYLADHLMKEQQGGGAEYRMTTLQKYADYVQAGRDFPLVRFTSRHSPATEAVGYGKALMFFHMVRRELGDKPFVSGLRAFYQKNIFRFASFDDLEESFETAAGKKLHPEFNQWITRTGAPELRLGRAAAAKRGDGHVVTATLEQVQEGDAYHLRVPVSVTMEGQERAFQTAVDMNDRKLEFALSLPARPLRLDVDPEFDLFRRLDRDEMPPAVTQALGAKKLFVLLPSSARSDLLRAYEAFAKTLAGSGPDETEVRRDDEVTKLPPDRAVAVLGWENRYLGQALLSMTSYELSLRQQTIKIGKTETPIGNHPVVLAARNPGNRNTALLVVAADRAQALAGLGRKLPHYHKYSYLVFEGEEPANVVKGRWPVLDSPLTAFLPGKDGAVSRVEQAKLAPREPLAALPPVYSEERMMDTVKYLSGEKLKGREAGSRELDAAARYVAEKFKQAGLTPGGDKGTYYQEWEEPRFGAMKNVIGVIPGNNPSFVNQSVVLGAHYDHLGLGMTIGRTEDRGKVHPDADDNASGVAVLLELAKVLKETTEPDRSIVFVAFTGEEEGKLGSRHYVDDEKRYAVSHCVGMVNLDTVGRLGNRKLLVLGAGSAQEWVHVFRGAGFVTGVDLETATEELDSSDQKSFQEAGVPAVQLFSGPHPDYHRPTDTADRIDPAGLVKVASVAKEAVEYLATRERPLTLSAKTGAGAELAPKTERKVSLGTVPDFAFSGKGFRLSGVVPGSPAESAGLKEGDVVIRVNEARVENLKDFSDFLKTLKPGDTVAITLIRDDREMTVEAQVKER